MIDIIKEPENMDGLIYFTQRQLGTKGTARAWVYKGMCEKCNKGIMSKPKDPKTGKVKIRAKEYTCPECGFTIEKKAYEETLNCEIKYTCPECGNEGEAEVLFKRRKLDGVDSVVFQCGKCNAKLGITKKMKDRKSKD